MEKNSSSEGINRINSESILHKISEKEKKKS